MTKILKSVVAMLAMVMIIASCGGSEDPIQSEKDRVTGLLTSGEWKIQAVSIDHVDKSAVFTGLQLKFNAAMYNAANGKLVWPDAGTWAFTNDQAKAFRRNDDVTVNIDEITSTKLVLSLDWDGTLGSGRVESVEGKHTFTFSK